MLAKPSRKTIRRSVVLPESLVEEAQKSSPPELRDNFNRMVAVSLQAWVDAHKRRVFQREIAQMARDPGIQTVSREISKAFSEMEMDGL